MERKEISITGHKNGQNEFTAQICVGCIHRIERVMGKCKPMAYHMRISESISAVCELYEAKK